MKTNPDIQQPLLEDVPDPNAALREIGRTSRYAVFKVPLEGHLYSCDFVAMLVECR